MVQIQAKSIKVIQLGHRGENESREVIFDLTDFISSYGSGTARLLHQRPGDPAPYIVPAVQEDSTLTWTVTDADTAAPGTGSAELQWMVNDVLAKSDIWNTRTKAALDDGATEPPTGAEGWYQQLIAYIDSLRGEGVSEEQIAAAVEAYLLEHPVEAPVTSVNGKTGAVQLSAKDVGALAQDELQTGVDTALEQAKASGEFDGQAGDDGGYYTPSVDAGGNLIWTGSKAYMPAVAGANIKGPPGTTGKSAYQYAVEGGYTGTETEFAAKLAEEIPDKLPNPNALTFTGAATGIYDGSAPLNVEIPIGGGSSTNYKLLAEYVHESNDVFQPTDFDAATGIFTCPGHGMTGTTPCVVYMNDDAAFDGTKIPGAKRDWRLVPAGVDTFTISNWEYASDANLSTIDPSAFHFEYCNIFKLVDIPICKKVHITMVGKLHCSSWLNFGCSLLEESKKIFDVVDSGSFSAWGRPGYSYGAADGIFYLESDIYVGERETVATRRIWRSDSNGGNKQFQNYIGRFHLDTATDVFKIEHGYSGNNLQGIANGFTVRVYRAE